MPRGFRQWSPLFITAPERYIETDHDWRTFDLRRWSTHDYRWQSDKWGGLKDTVSPVSQTIATGRGDCDDYALVALSSLYADVQAGRRDLDDLGVCMLYLSWWPLVGHVIVYTDQQTFDVGTITEESIGEYLDRTDHVWKTTRPVSLPR